MEVEAAETKALMGADYWRYGVKDCRHEIEVMTRYAHEQGLTQRKLERRGAVRAVDLRDGEDLSIYSFGSTCSPNNSTVRTGSEARLTVSISRLAPAALAARACARQSSGLPQIDSRCER